MPISEIMMYMYGKGNMQLFVGSLTYFIDKYSSVLMLMNLWNEIVDIIRHACLVFYNELWSHF